MVTLLTPTPTLQDKEEKLHLVFDTVQFAIYMHILCVGNSLWNNILKRELVGPALLLAF